MQANIPAARRILASAPDPEKARRDSVEKLYFGEHRPVRIVSTELRISVTTVRKDLKVIRGQRLLRAMPEEMQEQIRRAIITP